MDSFQRLIKDMVEGLSTYASDLMIPFVYRLRTRGRDTRGDLVYR